MVTVVTGCPGSVGAGRSPAVAVGFGSSVWSTGGSPAGFTRMLTPS